MSEPKSVEMNVQGLVEVRVVEAITSSLRANQGSLRLPGEGFRYQYRGTA